MDIYQIKNTITALEKTFRCRACGFREQAYFQRVFKKAEGITPGQYRKEHYREQLP